MRITTGAILGLDDDENRDGLLLIKPRRFVEQDCADEVIASSDAECALVGEKRRRAACV
jgi:hypothetical protein